MDPELKKSIDDLAAAIRSGSQWEGQTNRELRDKVELASKEVNALNQTFEATKKDLNEKIIDLSKAIDRASESSTKLSGRMVLLTIIIALAAVAAAVAPFIG